MDLRYALCHPCSYCGCSSGCICRCRSGEDELRSRLCTSRRYSSAFAPLACLFRYFVPSHRGTGSVHTSLLAGSPYAVLRTPAHPIHLAGILSSTFSLGGPRHHPMDFPWTQPIPPQLLLNQCAEWPTEGTSTYLGIGVIAGPIFYSFFFFL